MLRRHLRRWPALLTLLTVCAAMALPSSAAAVPTNEEVYADCLALQAQGAKIACVAPEARLARPNHVGWAYLNLNYCPPGMACTMRFASTTAAWRWTGKAWTSASLDGGWVYVYPYSGQWRWAWTQKSGWVAISGGRFELR